jgi:Tfp pilus assembly protein PilF
MARYLERWWLHQKASWLVFLKKPTRAQELLTQMVAADPGDLRARTFLSSLLAEAGQTDQALDQLKVQEQVTPNDASLLFNIGFLYEQSNRSADAERYFRRAIELKPEIDRAWYGLGLVLIKQGRLQEALDALKRNTELQPMSPYGWYQLAMTHHHLGQDGEARDIRKHLEKFEPKVAKQLARDLDSTPATAGAAAGVNG